MRWHSSSSCEINEEDVKFTRRLVYCEYELAVREGKSAHAHALIETSGLHQCRYVSTVLDALVPWCRGGCRI